MAAPAVPRRARSGAKTPPFAKGSVIWQQKGPLPVWAWALVVLLAVLVFTWWRRNRATATATEATTGYTSQLPGDQSAPPVFIVPVSPPPPVNVAPADVTVNPTINVPPPIVTPSVVPPPATVPTAPPAGGSPPPVAPPGGAPPTPSPPGGYVTVTKWPDSSVPRESTLWDIAGSWLPAGAAQWQQIWNHPLNNAIRVKRGDPKYIQAWDQFFVPNKLATPRSSY